MTDVTQTQFRRILSNISLTVPVDLGEVDPGTEWVQISSSYLSDADLFGELEARWDSIASEGYENFALIYCRSGPYPGVWIHHLCELWHAEEYDYGTFTVSSWW